MNTLSKSVGSIVADLLFPPRCVGCGTILPGNLKQLCLDCLSQLDTLDFAMHDDNPMIRHLFGRCRILYGGALFGYYPGGRVQSILQHIKYQNRTQLAIQCGEWLGRNLKRSILFQSVDALVPVPLHPKKLKQRGYNQSTLICEGIQRMTKWPIIEEGLLRVRHTPTQTKLGRVERCMNMRLAFRPSDQLKSSKHVLLVDDVLTTGATIEACILAIQEMYECDVSICSLAVGGV